jgi:lysophospholipase L1-like esterase
LPVHGSPCFSDHAQGASDKRTCAERYIRGVELSRHLQISIQGNRSSVYNRAGLILALVVGCVLGFLPLAQASAGARYYLSLGDSLAQGMQPNESGLTVNTNQGYADQLYSSEKTHIARLKLIKLGCGGESTTSFLTGHGNPDGTLLGCNPVGGSQMAAAERFLRKHHRRGEIALLTLDIGANDVDGCAPESKIKVSCVTQGVEHINANLPMIMRRLRKAAPAGTPMAAMTLYDPFLQLYLTPGNQTEAITIDAYAHNLNNALTRLYRAGKFRVAQVDAAFDTYDLSKTTSLAGQSGPVPVAVANICQLTWMCAPAPVGPNIHANQMGYGVIAHSFATAFARLR